MRTVLKRLVMLAYCHGWIGSRAVQKAFYYFDLSDQ
jgi:hypothetical protein